MNEDALRLLLESVRARIEAGNVAIGMLRKRAKGLKDNEYFKLKIPLRIQLTPNCHISQVSTLRFWAVVAAPLAW
jgi:hypothetical protein